jgi:hypothetical protein
MSKNNTSKVEKLLKKDKIRTLLSYWKNNPKNWIRSCELRDYFVNGNRNIIKREDDLYYDSDNEEILKEKPEALYRFDSELYRDLTDLKKTGILAHKEDDTGKGKPESYYKPSEKYIFEPVKSWHHDTIKNCPFQNILSTQDDLTLYFSNFSIEKDFTKKDVETIGLLGLELSLKFVEIDIALKKISERKANRKWKEFIDNFPINSETKLFLWIYFICRKILILFPNNKYLFKKCLETITPEQIRAEKKISGNLGTSFSPSEKLLHIKRSVTDPDSYVFPFISLPLLQFNRFHPALWDNIVIELEKEFLKLIEDIAYAFIKRFFDHASFDAVYDKVQMGKKTKSKFWQMINETDNILQNYRMYLAVKEPTGLLHEDLQEAFGIETKYAKKIAYSDRTVLDPFPDENIYEDVMKSWIERYPEKFPKVKKKAKRKSIKEREKIIFFRKYQFFKGFEDKIQELDFDVNMLYEKMDEYANIFEMPKIVKNSK